MSGRDLIGIAKTGSGKTLAFILPMLRHILDQAPLEPTEGPIAVCLAPTRELALQTYNEVRKMARVVELRVTCVYGGSNVSDQIADLKRGAEIVVCTPGRMIDMLTANNGKVVNLRRTTYVVLDEADRMFDMGFEPQVMRILDNIRPDRQTVLFSATFPRQMEALARRILQRPIEIQVGGRSVVSDSVTQHVIVLRDDQKFMKLLELLGLYQDQGSIIVFVEKQLTADVLLRDLMSAGHACLSLHGGIDQQDRDSNIKDFKDGNIRLLIATSVAARGLDVKSLVLVVNFDCPNHYEDYVHRCGRTGRAGNKGTAFTFVTADDENYCGEIVRALELSGAQVPLELQAMWDRVKATMKQSKKSGFGGKGFKFNELEALQSSQMKMLTMRAHNQEGKDEEEDDYKLRERELAAEIEDKVAMLMGQKPSGGAAGEDGDAPLMLTYTPSGAAEEKKEAKASNALVLVKPAGEASTASAGVAGPAGSGTAARPISNANTLNKVAAAAARASEINRRFFPQTKQSAADVVEVLGSFQEEIEINDFPPAARMRVTRREAVEELEAQSGVAITVRGVFIPPEKKGQTTDRPLYLLIEGKTQSAVTKGKQDIELILREELHRQATSYQPAPQMGRQPPGRYKVLSLTN